MHGGVSFKSEGEMLDNFREIYNKELRRYDYESSLEKLILSSKEVRMFVYEICEHCIEAEYKKTKEG